MGKPSRVFLAISLCAAAARGVAAGVTYTVTNAGDSGAGSLRQAILDANGHLGADNISFNISGTGLHTIAPASALPDITDAVTIDGYTQPGASVNTNGPGLGLNSVLAIEIDCTNAGTSCLNVSASNTTIRGLVINRSASNALAITSGSNNKVEGCFLGTNAAGTGNFASKDFWAIMLIGGTSDTIGGLTPDKRNLIGGNFRGIEIGDNANTGHLIQGNLIGTNKAGAAALNPTSGTFAVSLRVVTNSTVGGTTPAAANVISGVNAGILIGNSLGTTTASNNLIEGNLIGTDVTGTAVIGISEYGIGAYNQNSVIGGTAPGAGNVIAGSDIDAGILISGGMGTVVQGNFIGTDPTGMLDLGSHRMGIDIQTDNCVIGGVNPGEGNIIAFNGGVFGSSAGVGVVGQHNKIVGNRIYGNKSSVSGNDGLGIDLANDGVTANDPCDADSGPNGLQNYPVLTVASSSAGSTSIQGTLNSVASTMYRIEFFSNAVCDPSGYGEGQTYLGFTDVTTDASCNAGFDVTLPVAVAPNMHVTATATDPSGNTSEFSRCIPLATKYYTIPPCRVADTRNPTGPYGGPALVAKTTRSFVVGGQCAIPANAAAVSFNFTVTQPTAQGDLRTFPGGATLPLVSTLNWVTDQTRANNAVVPLGPSGDIVARVDQGSGTVQFVIDVNGYFQ